MLNSSTGNVPNCWSAFGRKRLNCQRLDVSPCGVEDGNVIEETLKGKGYANQLIWFLILREKSAAINNIWSLFCDIERKTIINEILIRISVTWKGKWLCYQCDLIVLSMTFDLSWMTLKEKLNCHPWDLILWSIDINSIIWF